MPDARWWAARSAHVLSQLSDRPSRHQLARLRDLAAAEFATGPLISVVMPVHNPPRRWFERAVRSVQAQVYPHWELCLLDDASTVPWVRGRLAELRADSRIRVAGRADNGHISHATNAAVSLASGAWVALLDQDDELSPLALLHVALAIARRPGLELVFSDEDKVDVLGLRYNPYRKPDFNPDLLYSLNQVSHLGVYRRDVYLELGGCRPGFEGSQDHDLALRVAARGAHVVAHVPHVLYHWRAARGSTARGIGEKGYAVGAAVRAIDERLAGAGTAAAVSTTAPFRGYRVRPRAAPGGVHVIATTGHDLPDLTAVEACPGSDVVVFLAAGATLADGDLDELAGQLQRPGVGAVGGAVVDATDRILDGGLWLGRESVPGDDRIVRPAWEGTSIGPASRFSMAQVAQTLQALSFSFLATRVDTLRRFPLRDALGRHADVGLGLDLADAGLRCLWLPELHAYGGSGRDRRGSADTSALLAAYPRLEEPDRWVPRSVGRRGSRYGPRLFDDSLGVRAAFAGLGQHAASGPPRRQPLVQAP